MRSRKHGSEFPAVRCGNHGPGRTNQDPDPQNNTDQQHDKMFFPSHVKPSFSMKCYTNGCSPFSSLHGFSLKPSTPISLNANCYNSKTTLSLFNYLFMTTGMTCQAISLSWLESRDGKLIFLVFPCFAGKSAGCPAFLPCLSRLNGLPVGRGVELHYYNRLCNNKRVPCPGPFLY